MKVLPHDFTTDFGVVDMAGIVGYQKALIQINEYLLKNSTQIGYRNYIDSDALHDCIKSTTLELKRLVEKEEEEIMSELPLHYHLKDTL